MSRPSIAAAVALSMLAVLFACKRAPNPNQTAEQAPAATSTANGAASMNAATNAAAAADGERGVSGVNPDVDFVTNAALSDMFEVAAGQYAQAHATSPAVKRFAAEMVKAHSATTAQLKGLLPDSGVTVTPPASLDAKHQQMLDNLKTPGPSPFDRLYISQQISAHEDAVGLFTTYSQKGANAPLTAWAAKTLPTIQHHLEMAQKLQTDLK